MGRDATSDQKTESKWQHRHRKQGLCDHEPGDSIGIHAAVLGQHATGDCNRSRGKARMAQATGSGAIQRPISTATAMQIATRSSDITKAPEDRRQCCMGKHDGQGQRRQVGRIQGCRHGCSEDQRRHGKTYR